MSLEQIDIENFRGVKGNYSFEPEGNNAVIVGPNGSGKSSILEAINYLFTNDIRQLSREGMNSVRKNNVIPNVDADGDCIVSGTFVDGDDQETTIERSIDSGDLDPAKEDLPDSLQQMIDIANHGQHILTRDDLLDLIIAQPSSRRDVLGELLNLPDIDERRLLLQRTRKTLESKKKDAEASRQSSHERLEDLTDSSAATTEQLRTNALSTINSLRNTFDGETVDEIDPDTVQEGIKSPVEALSTEALQREQPREELTALVEWLEDLGTEYTGDVARLQSLLDEYRDYEASEVSASRVELLELGENLISAETEVCPLCKQDWRGDGTLLADVRRRREQLHDLQTLIDEIDQRRSEIREDLNQILDYLEYLTKELGDEYQEAQILSEYETKFQDTIEILSGDLLDKPSFDVWELPVITSDASGASFAIGDLSEACASLQSKAESLDEPSETDQKYQLLMSIAERWKEYEDQGRRVDALDSLVSDVKTAESAFISARKEVIGEIYEEITGRVESYYTSIHPDESDTGTNIEVTETGAELKKEFYDDEEYPPHSVFSEGHLDTLGLCLHLALADYLQQDEKSILLLDDVVMSVDQDHRLEIARMIANEFAEDYQMIITTHDELWAEQLSSQGALQGGPQIRLREWSFNDGVKESRGYIDVYDQWNTVEDAMDNDEMEKAAHELRYATERMLQQCAMSLGGKVEYDPRLRHTLSDFKDSVCRRLDTLTGRAKNNLDTSSEMFDQANELDNEYGEILNEVGERLDKVNRRVHWTPGRWLTLSPDEFEEVFEAHKAAYELLYCDECGSSIRYEEFDGDYHEFRCNCRGHYDIRWN